MKKRAIGRPIGQNRALTPSAKKFFDETEKTGLTLRQVHDLLDKHFEQGPSYRTLQEWRRGINRPKFAPFELWSSLLLGKYSQIKN